MVEKTEVWGGKVIYPRLWRWQMGIQDSHTGYSWPSAGGSWPLLLISMLIAYNRDGLSLAVAYASSISWCSRREI